MFLLSLVQTFCDDIKKEVTGQKVLASLKPAEQLIKVVHDRLKSFLGGQDAVPFHFSTAISSDGYGVARIG